MIKSSIFDLFLDKLFSIVLVIILISSFLTLKSFISNQTLYINTNSALKLPTEYLLFAEYIAS